MQKKFLHKKLIALLLVATFLIPPVMFSRPQKAEAIFGFMDTVIEVGPNLYANLAETIKDYGVDAIAWIAAKIIISKMISSVVTWANSGFNGAPAFVSNPEQFFGAIGGQVAGDFIANDPSLNFLCSPFQSQLRIAVARNNLRYVQPFNVRCTLSNVISNIDAFTDSFSQGGWGAWYSMTQEPQNNPLGSFLMVDTELNGRVGRTTIQEKDKLDWGNGFLTLTDDLGNAQTPGKVIADQLNNSLSAGTDSLVAADEINELIGALLSALVNKVFGSGGLRGSNYTSGDADNDVDALTRIATDAKPPSQGDLDSQNPYNAPPGGGNTNVCSYGGARTVQVVTAESYVTGQASLQLSSTLPLPDSGRIKLKVADNTYLVLTFDSNDREANTLNGLTNESGIRTGGINSAQAGVSVFGAAGMRLFLYIAQPEQLIRIQLHRECHRQEQEHLQCQAPLHHRLLNLAL